jgi:hypothetical protein
MFGAFDKMYLIYQIPKLHELEKMVCCGDLVGVKLLDPKILVQPFLHREVLSFGDGEDGWCNFLGPSPVEPRRLQKASRSPISDGDCGRRIEEFHARLITRMLIANPSLGGVFPT